MVGEAELLRLAELFRFGAETLRRMGDVRQLEADALYNLAERVDLMVAELGAITEAYRASGREGNAPTV